jgi:hypothetical protein
MIRARTPGSHEDGFMIRPAERFSVRTPPPPPYEEDRAVPGRGTTEGVRWLLVLVALALGVTIGGLAPTVDLPSARSGSSIAAADDEVRATTGIEPAAGR